MSRFTNYRNQNSTNKAARESRARKYEDGYLSRSSLAVRLGLKPQGGWITVQKALCRIGYMKAEGPRIYVVTEEGLRYSRVHEELEAGDVLKAWVIWSPIVVEQLREAVAWVLANPGLHPVTGKPNGGKFDEAEAYNLPPGYHAMTGLARRAGVNPAFAAKMLVDWGFSRQLPNGKIEAIKPDDSDAPLSNDHPRKFNTPGHDATGEPNFIYLYPERIVDDLKEEWSERMAKIESGMSEQSKMVKDAHAARVGE